MVFCYQNCSDLLWENCSSDREKLLKFEAEGREFAKEFEITRTIYSNSERSEQFLVTECFFSLFLEVSYIILLLIPKVVVQMYCQAAKWLYARLRCCPRLHRLDDPWWHLWQVGISLQSRAQYTVWCKFLLFELVSRVDQHFFKRRKATWWRQKVRSFK